VSDVAATTSAGGGGDDAGASTGSGAGGSVRLNGAVEKGPFFLGSRITVSALDAALAPTGDTFETETTSDQRLRLPVRR